MITYYLVLIISSCNLESGDPFGSKNFENLSMKMKKLSCCTPCWCTGSDLCSEWSSQNNHQTCRLFHVSTSAGHGVMTQNGD